METLYGADLPAYKIKHHSGWGMWLHDPPAGISPGARQTNLVFGQRQKNTLGRREFRDENILLDRFTHWTPYSNLAAGNGTGWW